MGITVIDGYHAPAFVGSLTLAVFLTAMTAARWFGTSILDRYGRIPLLRASVGASILGLLLVVFSPSLALAVVGAAVWGTGTALGFPVGMSAAADDPTRAAARVSVVASIGYVAFLAGPAVVGLLGNHLGVRHALTAAVGVLAVGLLVSTACRQPTSPQEGPATHADPPAHTEPSGLVGSPGSAGPTSSEASVPTPRPVQNCPRWRPNS